MRAALFLAKGFEEIEAVGIIDVLRRGGIELTIVTVSGSDYVDGAHGIIISGDTNFYTVDYSIYDMLILPGGMPGTTNLKNHVDLCELLDSFHKDGKWIAALCAAPSILGDLGILEGEKATCYPGFEKSLQGAEIIDNDIVVSNKIITGRGPGVTLNFALKILEQFISYSAVEDIRKRMIISKYI